MCTAISFGGYAGRNLDVDSEYGEKIIISPRSYSFSFKCTASIDSHYAIIGIGISEDNYPLYFDAANEKGLYIAGLNYVGNAKYLPQAADKINLAPYELIPYLLSRCATVAEAEYELSRINLTNIPFRSDIPLSELHFFISDSGTSIVAEPDVDGLKIYKNPAHVLTNNPPFPIQLFNLNNYMHLTSEPAENHFSSSLPLSRYSFGMGAIGLPGDLSSASRFVRATFHRANLCGKGTLADILHLLTSVEMPNGSVRLGCRFERTEYTSAVDLTRLIYSYRKYDSPSTYAVRLSNESVDGSSLIYRELINEKEPLITNGSVTSQLLNKI